MISFFQSVILGAVQGLTELFPISSLGHSVILPSILGWKINRDANDFLIFLVATHFATALTLFLFYWRDWKGIILAILKSFKQREINSPNAKLGWLLVVSTVPAGMTGLLFQDQLKTFFSSPVYVSFFLACNGLMLFAAEFLRKKAKPENAKIKDADQRISAELSFKQSFMVGLMQTIALVPGFSRTGATITGGLMAGLSHEDALRFSFLLATPIIGAAAVLKLPELIFSGNLMAIESAFIGAISAAAAAYFSVKFLTGYFKTNKLTPFAIYCLLAGTASLIWLLG